MSISLSHVEVWPCGTGAWRLAGETSAAAGWASAQPWPTESRPAATSSSCLLALSPAASTSCTPWPTAPCLSSMRCVLLHTLVALSDSAGVLAQASHLRSSELRLSLSTDNLAGGRAEGHGATIQSVREHGHWLDIRVVLGRGAARGGVERAVHLSRAQRVVPGHRAPRHAAGPFVGQRRCAVRGGSTSR